MLFFLSSYAVYPPITGGARRYHQRLFDTLEHLLNDAKLLVNLTFALAIASACAGIAIRLGQSAMLGYILGGIAIGPHTPGFVGDPATVDALANIGVILLLFSIGVQVSVRDMLRSGTVAGIGGGAQILATVGIGYLIGRVLGWSWIEALFLGAVVSNSSSTVLSKIIEDRGESGSLHSTIALAWSTVQDLSTIVLVLVLTSLAGNSEHMGMDLAYAFGRALLFLALVIPVGVFLLPHLFEQVAALKSREVLVITTAAFALGTAYLSSRFGLSLGLGAFVAGVVVSESDLSHQIAGEIMPLRDIFAALFFVSVGMLIDPLFVVHHWAWVLVVLVIIVLVKGVISAGLVSLFGFPPRVALLTGAALAQSAEFSFLLARLGLDLDAVSRSVYDTLLAGSVASILVAPFLHSVTHRLAVSVDRIIPAREPLSVPTSDTSGNGLRGHAIICGYGRVGQIVGEALKRRRFPMVIIEQNPRVARQLHRDGTPVLIGSADNRVVLDQAGIARARVLVIAVPDAMTARRTVDYARRVAPRIDIVVRTHSISEREALVGMGTNEAVIGEMELALEMTRHTLHRFGVGTLETQAVIQGLRDRLGTRRSSRALTQSLPSSRPGQRVRPYTSQGQARPGRWHGTHHGRVSPEAGQIHRLA